MKIHYVAPHFHPEIGGVEDHVLRLGRYMVDRGHEVTVHTSRESITRGLLPQQEEMHGIMIRRYMPEIKLGYYATTFRPSMGEGDILHCHGYAFLPNDFSVRHYRGRMGVVFTTHHGVRMTPPNLRGRVLRRIYDNYGLGTLRESDMVLTSSDADRNWLLERRIPARKVSVVPDGISDDAFLPGDKGAAARHGLQNYVMFLGRVHREKCIDHLFRAVAKLGRRDLMVAVVGPDEGAMGDLHQVAERVGILPSVRFLGRVSQEDKKGLLAGCRVLVLPSLYEAQGLVILEAWAQGRPVVASRVGGVPDMIREGENGVMYEWGNVDQLAGLIARVLDDHALAANIGSRGMATAGQHYRWSSVAGRIEGIYIRVLSEKPWRHKPK